MILDTCQIPGAWTVYWVIDGHMCDMGVMRKVGLLYDIIINNGNIQDGCRYSGSLADRNSHAAIYIIKPTKQSNLRMPLCIIGCVARLHHM